MTAKKIFFLSIVVFSFLQCLTGECRNMENLSTGDNIYCQDDTIIVHFLAPRKVLSTAVYNGGYREDLQGILNHHSSGENKGMTFEIYKQEMQELIKKFGYNPALISAMGTGVPMKNAVIAKEKYKDVTVTAIVTAGIAGNSGRIGDPAHFEGFSHKEIMPAPGTINIILLIDSDMNGGVMARSLVTATEAKTAALQELIIGSKYSSGLATGTGTDQMIIIANPQSEIVVQDTGKHNKIGELIGRVVKKAVKRAIFKHNGIDEKVQHSFLRRAERFSITKDSLFYNSVKKLSKPNFDSILNKIDKDDFFVVETSLYFYLLDQYSWKLLGIEEVSIGCEGILNELAQHYGVPKEKVGDKNKEGLVLALEKLVGNVINMRGAL
jgi:adenosylcobinamide hydrolase